MPSTQTDLSLKAKVTLRGGVPTLLINDQPTAPLIFFWNTEVPENIHTLAPQMRLASGAGVHIYSFCLPWPWEEEGAQPDFSAGEAIMDQLLEHDPQALFIPRMRCEGSDAWLAAHPDERVVQSDGASPLMNTMASSLWKQTLERGFARAVRHYENSRFAPHILAYHPAGQNSNEWFHYEFWVKGRDYSPRNAQAFRQWLRGKYESDQALAQAWGQTDLTFESVQIPAPLFADAVRDGDASHPLPIFNEQAGDQASTDYNHYSSDIIADCLIDLSRVIKEACGGHKLVVQFYGYLFEHHGSYSGHQSMMRLLECPDVDMLASPLSYVDRQMGGVGGFMTAVDSVAAHGKLWIVENDYRTHALDVNHMPEWMSLEGLGPIARDQNETLAVIKREFGSLLMHRAGTWWMDLISGGAYNDPAIWETVRATLKPLYEALFDSPTPYVPQVAYIVDERGLDHLRMPANPPLACYNPVLNHMRQVRNELGRSGVTAGYYYLEDFLNGLTPRAPLYWFGNAYGLSERQIEGVLKRLDHEGATAVWHIAPGCLDRGSFDARLCERLCGMKLSAMAGSQGSLGNDALDNISWGDAELYLAGRLHVDDSKAQPLACYRQDGHVCAAQAQHGAHRSVFLGEAGLCPQLLRALFAHLGLHVWNHQECVIQCDGRWLFVHSAQAGLKEILLPAGQQARAIDGCIARQQGPALHIDFPIPGTQIFELTESKA